jgi:hypothetical protein
VAAPHVEEAWPETIVLDSTRFMYTDSITGTSHQLFSLLAAWGYPAGVTRGRLWRLRAYPQQDAATWKQFLAELPGRPQLVIIDRDYGAIGGVRAHWGRGRNEVPVHLCEHHLYERGKKALVQAGHTAFGDPLQAALAEALQSPEGWDTFYALADQAAGARASGHGTGTSACARRPGAGPVSRSTTPTARSRHRWRRSSASWPSAAGPSATPPG